MTGTEKKVKELAAALNTKNHLQLVKVIEALRNEEPFTGAVNLLASLYDQTDSHDVSNSISSFFNDLKESSVRAEVIHELKSVHEVSTLTMLAASCWQSGMDYSPWVRDFAQLFMSSDYVTALECFTVIEEYSNILTEEVKNDLKIILNQAEKQPMPEKNFLRKELISILS